MSPRLSSSITLTTVFLALLSLFPCALAELTNGPRRYNWHYNPFIKESEVGAIQKCLDDPNNFQSWGEVACAGKWWYSESDRWNSPQEGWSQCKATIQDALNERFSEGGCETIGGKYSNRAAYVGYRNINHNP